MKNIFKVFKENKKLSEENKLLKLQNDALTEFRKSFDNYYADISGVKVITKNYDKQIVLSGTFSLDRDGMYYPSDMLKEDIARKISKQLVPLMEFDVIDNEIDMTKDIIGRLIVLTK